MNVNQAHLSKPCAVMHSLPEVGDPLPISTVEEDAIRKMAFATEGFEPYPMLVIGRTTLRSLIRKGVVECGESIRPAVGKQGFRLTKMGRDILQRVWWPGRTEALPFDRER